MGGAAPWPVRPFGYLPTVRSLRDESVMTDNKEIGTSRTVWDTREPWPFTKLTNPPKKGVKKKKVKKDLPAAPF
jgi:hypothetical protein